MSAVAERTTIAGAERQFYMAQRQSTITTLCALDDLLGLPRTLASKREKSEATEQVRNVVRNFEPQWTVAKASALADVIVAALYSGLVE